MTAVAGNQGGRPTVRESKSHMTDMGNIKSSLKLYGTYSMCLTRYSPKVLNQSRDVPRFREMFGSYFF